MDNLRGEGPARHRDMDRTGKSAARAAGIRPPQERPPPRKDSATAPVTPAVDTAALDIARTARTGRGEISARETAVPFRIITGRLGLPPAILVQISLESLAAALAVPAILGHPPLHPPSAATFCVLAAAFHTYGYLANRPGRPNTSAGHPDIKSSDVGASAPDTHPSGPS